MLVDSPDAFGEARHPRLPPEAIWVAQLWVAPRQREKKLGRELMNGVTRWAIERHAAQIFLGVKQSNLGYADTGMRVPAHPIRPCRWSS
jgi:GNAT superfamily N-acetyltransferase